MTLLSRLYAHFATSSQTDDTADSRADASRGASGQARRRAEAPARPTETPAQGGADDGGRRDRDLERGAYRHQQHTRLPGAADPARIAEAMLDHEPAHAPRGRALTARVTRTSVSTLVGVVNELEWRLLDPAPVLIAVPHDREALRTAAEAFGTTLAIAPNREAHVPAVQTFVPFLFKPGVETGPIGSVRLIHDFDVADATPTQSGTLGTLRQKRGRPLHGQVKRRRPAYFAFAAPGAFHDITRGALASRGQVLGGLANASPTIQVAGLAFTSIDDWFGPTGRLRHPVHNPIDDGVAETDAETDAQAQAGEAPAGDPATAQADGGAAGSMNNGITPPTTMHELRWTDEALELRTWRNYPDPGPE
jgi:hypothetical protein